MNENKFEASNPLVSSLANKIENALPDFVQKELANQGIKFFTEEEALISFINQ